MQHAIRTLRRGTALGICAASLLVTGTLTSAQQPSTTVAMQAPAPDPRFARFVPSDDTVATRLDFSLWNEALNFFVFSMGASLRERAPSVLPNTGTRRVYGHTSGYRLEANRVTFSFLEDDVIESLTGYRRDLEALGDEIDIARLSRNEQLAYWINLHNVAVIEQIARNYPLKNPSELMIDGYDRPLDTAPFITVNGVSMSPQDIRTKIVFANWSDPKVMYGFFRGDIGGPSLRREAFTAANVGDLLDSAATEFANALRAVDQRGSTMRVSRIYDEARPYYFTDWPQDIREHIGAYASEEVRGIIADTSDVEPVLYENAIADLANGEKDPGLNYVTTTDENGMQRQTNPRIAANIERMVQERDAKVAKMLRNRERVGQVYVIPTEELEEAPEAEEVD